MAIWSLVATMVSDPGFVPKGYRYDFTMMTRITKQLYDFAKENQSVTIEVNTSSNLGDYKVKRAGTSYNLIIDAPEDFVS